MVGTNAQANCMDILLHSCARRQVLWNATWCNSMGTEARNKKGCNLIWPLHSLEGHDPPRSTWAMKAATTRAPALRCVVRDPLGPLATRLLHGASHCVALALFMRHILIWPLHSLEGHDPPPSTWAMKAATTRAPALRCVVRDPLGPLATRLLHGASHCVALALFMRHILIWPLHCR